jgi:ATP-dependent exoDNAse (exonuclease V) beta subunit
MLKQIKASAGSGKTYALSRIYLDLLQAASRRLPHLSCSRRPRNWWSRPEVVAITFTIKAAAEMKTRVATALKRRALGLEAGPAAAFSQEQAKTVVDELLLRFNEINIRTIDSLLAAILRLFALECGLPADFDIAFEQRRVLDEALERVMDEAEGSAAETGLRRAFDSLLSFERIDGFWIGDVLRERLIKLTEQLLRPGPAVLTDQDAMRAMLAPAQKKLASAAEALARAMEQTEVAASKNFEKFLQKIQNASLRDGPPSSAYASKENLAACALKASRDRIDEACESIYRDLKAAHAEYAALHGMLSGPLALAPAADLARNTAEAALDYEREHGVVLGDLIAYRAAQLLQDGSAVPDAWCRLGASIHHLLVDEFQDTSRDQWRALAPMAVECLAKAGGLVYVGDVKQSIYGWRGGEPALFEEAALEPDIEALCDCERLVLPYNWRSLPEVVAFNNRLFASLETPEDAAEAAEALLPSKQSRLVPKLAVSIAQAFAESEQAMPPNSRARGGYVRVEAVEGASVDQGREAARNVLQKIVREVLPRRPARDVCVLVRDGASARLASETLLEMGLSVVTENSLELTGHPLVREILALLALLDDPSDDASCLAVLLGEHLLPHGPGVEERDVLDFLAAPREPQTGLLAAFAEAFPETYDRWLAPLFRSPAATPYERIYEIGKMFQVKQRRPGFELVMSRLLEIAHLAEEQGRLSPASFLELIYDESEGVKVPLPETLDAVRIMTIHKAKGLEFPVVVAPFLDWSIRADGEFADMRLGPHRIIGPMRASAGEAYEAALLGPSREALHLLYVCFTRARDELYAVHVLPGEGRARPMRQAMGVLLASMLGRPVDAPQTLEFGCKPEAPGAAAPGPEPASAAPPEPPPNEGAGEDESFIPGVWAPKLRVMRHLAGEESLTARRRGELLHKALELARIQDDPAVAAARAVALARRQLPVPEEDIPVLEKELAGMLAWLRSVDGLPEVLAAGRAEAEIIDENGQLLRADLFAALEHEDVVLEYKTGRPEPTHKRQLQAYLRTVQTCRGRSCRGVLVYLDLRRATPVALD